MITLSPSFRRAIIREMTRRAGSLAVLLFYTGELPHDCEHPATGEKIASVPLRDDAFMQAVFDGNEPVLPAAARCWRVLDNEGRVVLQGDGR